MKVIGAERKLSFPWLREGMRSMCLGDTAAPAWFVCGTSQKVTPSASKRAADTRILTLSFVEFTGLGDVEDIPTRTIIS
jgi:hypothetical protein